MPINQYRLVLLIYICVICRVESRFRSFHLGSTLLRSIIALEVENNALNITTMPKISTDSLSKVELNSNLPRSVVIIGSGPAGCTAAIYTSRALLHPLVVAGYQPGGQLMLTNDVENFPGYANAISGPDMMADLTSQAKRFGAEFWSTNCQFIDTSKYPFVVHLPNGTITTKCVIIATGAESVWLKVPGEEKYRGKGISTCATCDGYIFRNKNLVVIGGGDSAMEEAIFLTRFANKVTIIHRRDTFRASKLMLKRALENPKIDVLLNTQVVSWFGQNGSHFSNNSSVAMASSSEAYTDPTEFEGQEEDVLKGAVLQNATHKFEFDGAFIAIGHTPSTSFLRKKRPELPRITQEDQVKVPPTGDSIAACAINTHATSEGTTNVLQDLSKRLQGWLNTFLSSLIFAKDTTFTSDRANEGGSKSKSSEVTLDPQGFVLTCGGTTATNVPGIFACGDCVDKRYKQAITAAGSGCQAAIDAERWLEEHSGGEHRRIRE